MRAIRVTLLMLIVAGFSFLSTLPLEGSAEPSTLQAISLAYPLRQRYKITSLYDHTGPGQVADSQIQICTGALVRNDPGAGDECSSGGLWSYTDGDIGLWNLRWDQDTPCAGGGPGWLWYDGHEGYDLACPNNTPANAARQGTARWSGNDLYIEHGTDYRTYYRHLSARSVNPGEYVHVGREIGRSGVGGTGAHLHFEAKRLSGGVWTYVDPYGWEAGNLWAGGEPFPMGYVDQNGAAHGPFQLDRPTIRDKWISVARRLGSPIEDDWSGACPSGVEATCCYQGFERGYIYYQGTCSASGSAQVVEYQETFLPHILASESTTAWNSTVYIRNLNAGGGATVSIIFLTADGRVLDSRVYQGPLSANATWEVDVRDVLDNEFLIRQDSNPVFDGSTIVAADQDVAVVVRTEKSNRVTAYTGILGATANDNSGWGKVGTTIYVPLVMYDVWGTWRTTLYVQNTSDTQATFTITYCRDNGTGCQTESDTTSLPPYGQRTYLPDEMGDNFVGSATIASNRPLAVVLAQEENAWGASDVNAFSSSGLTVHLPSLMRTWYDWTSAFVVQNPGSSEVRVHIRYIRDNGQEYVPSANPLVVPAHGSRIVHQVDDPQFGLPYDNWHGSAVLTSQNSRPFVVLVNQQRTNPWNHQSYSGYLGGGNTLYGPFAAEECTTGGNTYNSSSEIQNLGDTSTSVTRDYYTWAGGNPIVTQGPTIVYGKRVATFSVWDEIPDQYSPFCGSVRVTRSWHTIVGVHNIARAPYTYDYGSSYNMVQRQ